MASNGAYSGNSDYSYLPLGWTCQTLVTSPGNVNLGYDVKFNPVQHAPVKAEAPVEEIPVAVPEVHEENEGD